MTAQTQLHLSDLAIATGRPLFAEPLHVGRPNVGSEQVLFDRLRQILDRRWLTNNGRMVQEFEAGLKEVLAVRHCIPVCNATVALEIAIRSLNMDGEVIVPSFTFIATAHALSWQGIQPVFCDIAPGTHNLDPEEVERLITPRTSGIIGVHIWGKPCPDVALGDIARRHNLALMYDASHAFACSSEGVSIGNFGRCEIFSFHATKFLNSFEGGAIATNDDELARKIRLMKNFGFAGVDRVVALGINGKMSEISAAMGLTGLESLPSFVETNRCNYANYRVHLALMPGIKLVDYEGNQRNNYQYVVLEVDEARAGLSRDELLAVLEAEQVLARRYFYPGCHRMEPYASNDPGAGANLPRTEALCERVLVLPTGTAVTPRDIDLICGTIRAALSEPEACRRLLAARLK